ncbi:copper amine oxidase N-terminal domain-containing protein [Paenibacillus spiritus]|uniref:Copper amine oxidase N-terminal domain-containing protein n=1 Tax=Paenibacillus spiritus TaxID=2496557 RepID=A0A5J5GK03_9BACL|nr:copper amine oxidase N-terminal domain-containing protein [Paenibacillus spiritus]KAA9008641.1 copper amine oxidase N-terminal domain-containing protein [Paenibacillus spiritus]
MKFKGYPAAALLTCALLAGAPAAASAAPAAAAPSKTISVYIDGKPVIFASGRPYMQDGTVMVPFRGLFEQLGLKIGWNPASGKLTGTSGEVQLALAVGSNCAVVNGTVHRLAQAPVNRGGTVYIPLRLVGEATGGTVTWNGSAVRITEARSDREESALVAAQVRMFVGAYNTRIPKLLRMKVVEGSPMEAELETVEEFFAAYNLNYTVNSLEVLRIQNDEATVQTVETTTRVSGSYQPDYRDTYVYELKKVDGYWKIYKLTLQNSEVLLTQEQASASPEIPASDRSLIDATVQSYYQYLNNEDTNGLLKVFTAKSDTFRESLKRSFTEAFGTSNLAFDLTASHIYYYSLGTAAVYVELGFTDKDAGTTVQRHGMLVLSRQADGTWTIDDIYWLPSDH